MELHRAEYFGYSSHLNSHASSQINIQKDSQVRNRAVFASNADVPLAFHLHLIVNEVANRGNMPFGGSLDDESGGRGALITCK